MLRTLQQRAETGYIACSLNDKFKALHDYDEFKLREWGFSIGDGQVTWSEPKGEAAEKLHATAYQHWKDKLFAQASEEANQGGFELDMSSMGLVAKGKQIFETEGYEVFVNDKNIIKIRWKNATKGRALGLKKEAESQTRETLQWVKMQHLLDIPDDPIDLRRIIRIPDKVNEDYVGKILKGTFPNSQIKLLTIERDFVVNYCV